LFLLLPRCRPPSQGPSDQSAAKTLLEIQAEFDALVQNKQDLEKARAKLQSRLRLAQQLDASFGQDVIAWKASISPSGSEEVDEVQLVCSCAVAAAHVTYAGAIPCVHRDSYFQSVEKAAALCFQRSTAAMEAAANGDGAEQAAHSFHLDPQMLVEIVQPLLEHVVATWPQGDFREWVAPQDAAIILMQSHCDRWPLVVDPLGATRRWIVNTTGATVLAHDPHSAHFVRELRRCLVEGRPAIIADADLGALWEDPRIRDLLMKRIRLNSRLVRSLALGQDDIEYNGSFQLYITTAVREVAVPNDFVPYVAVVHASVGHADLAQSLTHHVTATRSPRLWAEIVEAHTGLAARHAELSTLNMLVLDLLGEGRAGSHGNHDKWIHAVSEAKAEAKLAEGQVAAAQLQFEKLGPRMDEARAVSHTTCAVLDTVISLSRANPSYQDFEICLRMLDTAIQAVGDDDVPLNAEQTMRYFISQVYPHLARGMFELDCKAFCFLLALKTEEALGRVPAELFSWFNKGLLNEATAAFDAYLRYSTGNESRRNTSRRPKPQSGIYATVRLDTTALPWTAPVLDVTDQFGKYKSEWIGWREHKNLQWRMPHEVQERLSPLQHLMVIATLRPTKLLEAAERYSRLTLDGSVPVAQTWLSAAVLTQQGNRSPVYLLDQGSGANSVTVVRQLAATYNSDFVLVTFNGDDQVAQLKAEFVWAMSRGAWFMVKCAHRNKPLYRMLATALATVSGKDLAGTFRFWVSANAVVSTPRHEGHFVIEAPQTLRRNLARLLANIPEDVCDCSPRPEWLAMLHNIVFIHCVLQARQLFGVVGSLSQIEWQDGDLWEVIEHARREYGTAEVPCPLKSVPSYMAAVYTRHMCDPRDKATLYALLDSWLSGAALRQGFEFQIGGGGPGYRAPTCLFLAARDTARATLAPLIRYRSFQEAVAVIETASPKLDQGRLAELVALGPNARINSQEPSRLFEMVQTLLCRSALERSRRALAAATGTGRLMSAATARLGPPPPLLGATASTPLLSRDPSVSAAVGATASATTSTVALTTASHDLRHSPQFTDTLRALLEKIPQRVVRHSSGQMLNVATAVAAGSAAVSAAPPPPVSAVVLFIVDEVASLNRLLNYVRHEIRSLVHFLAGKGSCTPHMAATVKAIVAATVPPGWEQASWRLRSDAKRNKSLAGWVDQLCLRHKELERLNDKRMRTPSVWLGGLQNPKGMLAALRLESMGPSNPEPTLRVEITHRDWSHLREPPANGDGIFVHRVSLDGAMWEAGLKDPHPGKRPHLSGVLHLTYAPMPEATGRQIKEREQATQMRRGEQSHTFILPAYASSDRTRFNQDDLIFQMEVQVEDLTGLLKWTTWCLCLSL
jgi:hypothetical protein